MSRTKLYTIGSQSRSYEQWAEILGELPKKQNVWHRVVKQNMSFIEAITYVKLKIIYVGEVFNDIEVLEVPDNALGSVKGRNTCQALCHCGKEFEVNIRTLKRGITKSCGCISKAEHFKTHGLSHHRLYGTWRQMNRRCNDPDADNYYLYGGAGVTVCPEWHWDNKDGLANFVKDMYPTFVEGHQLDKDKLAISGQPKVYSKATCCWVTPADNVREAKAILNVEQVKEIKQKLNNKASFTVLAREYGVAKSTINDIKAGRLWKNV